MTETPESDGTEATPPLEPFTSPSRPPAPDHALAEPAPPEQPAWTVPSQPGPAQPGPGSPPYLPPPGTAYSAQPGAPYAQPGAPYAQPGAPYGVPPAGAGYGSTHPGYQPYPTSGTAYPPRAKDPTLAEWWRRLLARLIDYVVLLAVTSPLWIAVFTSFFHHVQDIANRYPDPNTPAAQAAARAVGSDFLGIILLVFLGWAVIWFAYDWLQHGLWGQTLGKRALGAVVVRAGDRGHVGAGAAAGRAAVFAFSPVVPLVGSIFALLNELWLLWDPQRQCLHDKAAHTIVVKKAALRPPGAY